MTAVPIADGRRFALFVADPAGGVFTASGSPQDGWSEWSSVSQGQAGGGTSVTAVPIGGERFALFVADPGGGVFTASGNAQGGWSGWSTVSQGQAGPGTSVAAVPIGGDRVALFVADPGGGVFTASGSPQGGWSGWSTVSQGQAGPGTSVTAVPIGGGRVALFVADPAGGVFTASGSPQGGWSPWSSVSQGQAGPGTSVTAVSIGGGRVALFVADPAGGVFTASGSPQGGWSPWSSVSQGQAGPGTSVTAVSIGGDRLAVFVADPAGGVFTTSGNAQDGWDQWSSVSQGRAGPGTSVTVAIVGGERIALFATDPAGGVFTALGDSVPPIKHFFVLMLENRSFDHMLGFSEIAGTDAETGQPTTIDGLTGTESNVLEGHTFTVTRGAPDTMRHGPGHNFANVLKQLCGPDAVYISGAPYPPIDNSGYVSDYANWQPDAPSPGDVMRCYTPDQLPVLHALAREFLVCDRWFCSMPGPTEPNRMFSHAATSGVFDDSPTPFEIFVAQTVGGFKFKQGHVFQHLEKADVKYRIYADDVGYDPFPFVGELDGITAIIDVEGFDDFAEDLADPDFDARYIHIEPSYDVLDDFEDGTSQHPLASVAAGERFIKAVYEAIRNSPVWDKSLLLITYDEHGGFYDHVVPPATQGTGERGRTHGFTFEQLGPRVPTVIVSPLIPRNLIDHRPYDHTAIPATLSRLFGIPSLGQRDGVSGGVDQLVGTVPRGDAPLTLPEVSAPARVGVPADEPTAPKPKIALRRSAAPLSDDPEGNVAAVVHRAVALHLQIAPADQRDAILARARLLTTRADAFAYLNEVQQLARLQEDVR